MEVEPCRPVETLAEDVVAGLFSEPRTLPPKYFYDEEGSRLFSCICDTEEYYLTRTENSLLRDRADRIIAAVRPDHIIELGSGTSRKSRHLLDACARQGVRCTYWPMDICREVVEEAGRELMRKYPWLCVNALVGDYNAGLGRLELPAGRRLAVFMGSSIGNYNHAEAVRFLQEVRALLSPQDSLLLGADRVKEAAVLNAAYDDSAGLTASFNLNLLKVLNKQLQADFVLDHFRHRAFFNKPEKQVEMHLVSRRRQTICFKALEYRLTLDEGSSIRTEISRKFTDDCLQALFRDSGFAIEKHCISDDDYFSLVLGRADHAGAR